MLKPARDCPDSGELFFSLEGVWNTIFLETWVLPFRAVPELSEARHGLLGNAKAGGSSQFPGLGLEFLVSIVELRGQNHLASSAG